MIAQAEIAGLIDDLTQEVALLQELADHEYAEGVGRLGGGPDHAGGVERRLEVVEHAATRQHGTSKVGHGGRKGKRKGLAQMRRLQRRAAALATMVHEYEPKVEDCYYDEAGRWIDLRPLSSEEEEAPGDTSLARVDGEAEAETQSRVFDPGGA